MFIAIDKRLQQQPNAIASESRLENSTRPAQQDVASQEQSSDNLTKDLVTLGKRKPPFT